MIRNPVLTPRAPNKHGDWEGNRKGNLESMVKSKILLSTQMLPLAYEMKSARILKMSPYFFTGYVKLLPSIKAHNSSTTSFWPEGAPLAAK